MNTNHVIMNYETKPKNSWCIERRYRIIDTQTLKVIDDCNGFGYKSIRSALKGYKTKYKKSVAYPTEYRCEI